MVNIIDKINLIIDKIGKRNLLLVLLVFGVVFVSGLYGTFSIFTTTDGTSMFNGLTTYKFILNDENITNSVTIASGSSKYVAITISNPEKMKLKYGIYYSSNEDLSDVNVGYLHDSDYYGYDVIDSYQDGVVNIKINNDSLIDVTISFGLVYGLNNSEDLILPDGEEWLDKFPPLASDYIKSLYNDGSSLKNVNIVSDNSRPLLSLNETQKIMFDNNGEYRYYGLDVNNFVNYNDELWRIISVSDVKKDVEDSVSESRVKIIKADLLVDDLGSFVYSFDSSDMTINEGMGVNDWSSSDLMIELNTLYYNRGSGFCSQGQDDMIVACDFATTGLNEDAKSLTDDAVYYLGSFDVEKGLFSDVSYGLERVSNEGVFTWSGRVGLMYPSDYLYAGDPTVCLNDGYDYNTDDVCINNNWLVDLDNPQWSITSLSSCSNCSFSFDMSGIISNDYTSNTLGVRPVQYLKSNVLIVSGTGTEIDPYQLKLF